MAGRRDPRGDCPPGAGPFPLLVMNHGEAHGFGASETVLTPEMLDEVYGVEARIEACSRGGRTLLIDGVSARAPLP